MNSSCEPAKIKVVKNSITYIDHLTTLYRNIPINGSSVGASLSFDNHSAISIIMLQVKAVFPIIAADEVK